MYGPGCASPLHPPFKWKKVRHDMTTTAYRFHEAWVTSCCCCMVELPIGGHCKLSTLLGVGQITLDSSSCSNLSLPLSSLSPSPSPSTVNKCQKLTQLCEVSSKRHWSRSNPSTVMNSHTALKPACRSDFLQPFLICTRPSFRSSRTVLRNQPFDCSLPMVTTWLASTRR